MIFKGVARAEEHNGHLLRSSKLVIHAPSVIRLTEYIHIPFERRSLSRKTYCCAIIRHASIVQSICRLRN
jgi:hypothetical protein